MSVQVEDGGKVRGGPRNKKSGVRGRTPRVPGTAYTPHCDVTAYCQHKYCLKGPKTQRRGRTRSDEWIYAGYARSSSE